MRAEPLAALLCGVVAIGAAACGGRATLGATAPRSQTPTELRSETQELLRSTENVLADVVATAERYASAQLDGKQALERLDAAHNRAQALGHRAEKVPTTSAARGVLMNLTADLATAAAKLENRIGSGQVKAPADVRSEVGRLRDQAFQAYELLRERLPFIMRRQVRRAVDRIFSLTG
jgi:hypothetical protein